jgi:hypothetical protein
MNSKLFIPTIFRSNSITHNEINDNSRTFKERYDAVLTRINLNQDNYYDHNIKTNIEDLEGHLKSDNTGDIKLNYLRERADNRSSMSDMAAEPLLLISTGLESLSLYATYVAETADSGLNILDAGALGALTLAGLFSARKINSYVRNYLLHDKEELSLAEYRKNKDKVEKIDITKYEVSGENIKKKNHAGKVLALLTSGLLLGNVSNAISLEKNLRLDLPTTPVVTKNQIFATTQRIRRDKKSNKYEILENNNCKKLEDLANEMVCTTVLPIDKNNQFTQYNIQNFSFNNIENDEIKTVVSINNEKIQQSSSNTVLDVLKFNIDDNPSFTKQDREKLWKIDNRIDYALNAIENENLSDSQIGEIYTQIETMREKLSKKKKAQIKKDSFKIATSMYNKDNLVANSQKSKQITGYTDYLINEFNDNKELFTEVQRNRIDRFDNKINNISNLENKILSRDFVVKKVA